MTLRLAVGTTAILLVVALPLAWWIASGHGPAAGGIVLEPQLDWLLFKLNIEAASDFTLDSIA
ncbi:hypothetical protein [Tunturiibacter gelidiferens]|uniref:hypothetical protein n=1 Tax=Tunturiibacter gelidiferens TaxID=3069689 RepID=UPI003D9BC0B1